MTARAVMVAATMRPAALAAFAVLAACAPTGASTSSSSTTSSTSSTSSTSEPTTSGTTDVCDGSGDCETEDICVADYTPSADPNNPGHRGESACRQKSSCIGALDLERFCFDHQSCCESLRCRPADGICEPPDLGQTGGETDTTTSTDASTTADSGSTSDTDTTTDTTTGTTGTTA